MIVFGKKPDQPKPHEQKAEPKAPVRKPARSSKEKADADDAAARDRTVEE